MFDFITVASDMDHFGISDTNLEEVQMGESGEVAKFDFSITFVYNPASNDNRLFCYFVCSEDVYEKRTVEQIAARFQRVSEQVFRTEIKNIQLNKGVTLINKLSLILPIRSSRKYIMRSSVEWKMLLMKVCSQLLLLVVRRKQ